MKTISMEYFEYQNDLTSERARITKLFEPLLRSVEFYRAVVAGQEQINPPMTDSGMLEEIFQTASEVKTRFKSGLY